MKVTLILVYFVGSYYRLSTESGKTLTCAVWLSWVRGEAHTAQVWELFSQVVFPCQNQRGRTQVHLIEHQDDVLL